MSNGSSNNNINFSNSNSNTASNSGKKNSDVETMDCSEENNNTLILRVWIVKKSIALGDISTIFASARSLETESEHKRHAFDIKNETKLHFKHWATILELSNGTYVNIQFGRQGFSLKEFNKTDIDGENVLDSIVNVWGYTDHPFSFCYLGNANYEYEKLKKKLKAIKNEELKNYNEKKAIYYNLIFKNCQHFACDIEKILFGKIQFWHSFDYYLKEFYQNFFEKININEL